MESKHSIPEVRLVDPVLEDDLGQALQGLVVSYDSVQVGGEPPGDRVEPSVELNIFFQKCKGKTDVMSKRLKSLFYYKIFPPDLPGSSVSWYIAS